jgi:flagellar P-ring protein precursor FlgI
MLITITACAADAPAVVAGTQVQVRVKDVTRVLSARENQLLGYGLVVGLNGTGDSTKTEFTTQSVSSMLQRLGVTVLPSHVKAKNVAAVAISATIGPFRKSGDRLDVTISSLGDATSLSGGILLQTPLAGADGKVYAVAQGSVSLGGYGASSGGAAVSAGHPTVGRIPNGALVEREIPMVLAPGNTLTFCLLNPDFTTAARVATALNGVVGGGATARDAGSVELAVPVVEQPRLVEFIARLGNATLAVDTPAKVVINERTGTVVVGGNVRVTPVAIAQGALAISVNPAFFVSQPEWLSEGRTVDKTTASIDVTDPTVQLNLVEGSSINDLVRTLNVMKVSPRDIIAILQALKEAGALQAELNVL